MCQYAVSHSVMVIMSLKTHYSKKKLTLGNNFLANFTDNVVVSGLKLSVLSVFDGAYHGEHGFVLFCC